MDPPKGCVIKGSVFRGEREPVIQRRSTWVQNECSDRGSSARMMKSLVRYANVVQLRMFIVGHIRSIC